MERHWILGLVALTTAALLWREVYSIACLSSKSLDNDNGVNGLDDCTNIEECELDEVCYVEKFVTENNPSVVKYRAGCRNIRDCKLISCSNQVTESVPTPRVGKRYIDEISLCTECCYNDTCNIKGCGSHAIDPERAKFHKKCFNCEHIKPGDNSTCKQMVWCDQPTQVCAISADPRRKEYNLKCEFKQQCELAEVASNISGSPLLLKCYDGHLKNFNPLSDHKTTVVADILPCPTGIVPTTPTTTTQKTTSTTTAATTMAQSTSTTTTKTTASTTPFVAMTSSSKGTTSLPTPTTVKVTTAIKQPTLKTTTTPPTTRKRPTLPPSTMTTTLAPTSPKTNSPSLPPVNPVIPIVTKVVTMAPFTTTSTALPITTTTTPQQTTTTTTTPKPTTTTTTSKPTTTTTTPKPTTTVKTTTRVTTTPTTTTKAGPPAGHTIAPNPTVCFVCEDGAEEFCNDLYVEKSCAPPNNYCINQVKNSADGNKIVNRTCGNFDRCFKDWYHGSSDTDVCQTFDENQYITLDFECVYCCVKDRCNKDMKPPADTLYEDK